MFYFNLYLIFRSRAQAKRSYTLTLFVWCQLVSQSGTQNFRDLVGMLYDRIIISAETSSDWGWPGVAGEGRGDHRRWPEMARNDRK